MEKELTKEDALALVKLSEAYAKNVDSIMDSFDGGHARHMLNIAAAFMTTSVLLQKHATNLAMSVLMQGDDKE